VATNAIHGRFGALYVDQSAGANGSPSQLGNLSDWNIDGKRDQVEVSVLGENVKTYVAGLSDFTGGLNGVLNTASNGIYTVGDGIARGFYLYIDVTSSATMAPLSGSGKGYWYGQALFNGVSTNGGVGDAVKWSIDWSAASSIYKV
jgi:hypothetical protein